MTRKIALKRLTKSDLTLFRWHFENSAAGNQKAINLNRDVFVDVLFPALPAESAAHAGRFPVDLYIYGPSKAPELNLQRKIIKWGEYKNWRLNGEFIENPVDDPSRFNSLAAGDFALIEFGGLHFPESARMCLVDHASMPGLHAECARLIGNRKMIDLSAAVLDDILAKSGVADVFPVGGTQLDADLEDAAQNGLTGTRALAKRAQARPITKEELEAALARASEIGNLGEDFINQYLSGIVGSQIKSFEWVSRRNAVAPYDFAIEEAGGWSRIDVKATSGRFGNRIHVSMGELLQMANPISDYRIYRLYELDGDEAKLRVSEPLRSFAQNLLPIFERLPPGVNADSISIDPEMLSFGDQVVLHISIADDDLDD